MSLIPINVFDDAISKLEELLQSVNFYGHPGINRRQALAAKYLGSKGGLAKLNRELGPKSSSDDKFQVNIDVHHFAPDEISVKVVDGYVVVEGKHEEKSDEHGFISRQFVRRFLLPQGCLPDTVESQLSSDGVLSVTAPKILPLPSKGEKIVPIIFTG